MTSRPQIVAISGSLRKGSFCSAILRSVAEAVVEYADIRMLPLDEVPLYNQDLDTDAPPAAVVALREAIGAADGLVIATPEYNYGMSGVLKNALDWASRPYGKSKLKGRAVLTLSSSPAATGGVRAQAQLNETLIANAALLVLRPQIVIGLVGEKVKDGHLVDAASLKFAVEGVNDLLRDIARAGAVIKQEV